MLLEIKRRWRKALIFPKVLWTLFIILIYMFGRLLPVPTVPINTQILTQSDAASILESLASVTGADLSGINLFTLGVGPWMMGMILWRFITVFDMAKHLTAAQVNRYRFFLLLLIATIQAYGVTANLDYVDFLTYSDPVLRLMAMGILVTGAVILTFLGNVNGAKGLGGMVIIVIVNMVMSLSNRLTTYFLENDFTAVSLFWHLVVLFLSFGILVMVTVILYRAEYRIPIKRIGINSAYNKGSYLPIRVTPAGAMPFMYGVSLMLLPPYIIQMLLSTVMPENEFLIWLSANIGISHLFGATVYLFLLYFLAIGFSYYNYDSYEIAKNMRNNGDYIENIRPGKPTQKYVQRIISQLAQFGALSVVVLGGLPLFIVVLQNQNNDSGRVTMALLISNVYIIASLLLGVIEQVNSLQNWKKYKNLF